MVRAFQEFSGMGQSQVPECCGIDLPVARHLINPCGVPGWTGGNKEPTTMMFTRSIPTAARPFTPSEWPPASPAHASPILLTTLPILSRRTISRRPEFGTGLHSGTYTRMRCSTNRPCNYADRSARRQSLRTQPARPSRPAAVRTASRASARDTGAIHCRSRSRAGRPVSLAAWRRTATLPEPAFTPPANAGTARPEEITMSLHKATPDQILAAAKVELSQTLKRLIACQNRLYRETGSYPDDLGAAIQRLEFLLYGIMAGLVSPAAPKAEVA